MAETTPSLPEAHIIRTYYPLDYAQSDTESEGEAQFEVDSEDEEQESISARLKQNQQFMDQQISLPSGGSSAWILEPQAWTTADNVPVVLIRKPMASNLSHRLLNPCIYRNIQNVGSLDDLASLLDTPDDWAARYSQVVGDGRIIRILNLFSALADDASESDVQWQFVGLVAAIALYLDIAVVPRSETKIIVGGILARYQYDLRSKTDPHFVNIDGHNLMASEAKTHRTFAPGEMWYHGCRGVQVLSALYAFHCPTFLFTQRQWKLFVETTERNAVLTFPYDNNDGHTPHVNSSLVQPMGTGFLKAIVICLLSRRFSLDEAVKAATLQELSQVKETPKKTIIKPKYFDTPDKPKRRSERLRSGPYDRKDQSTFISGYVDGEPVYSTVRVLPPEVVSKIEDEIDLQEKVEFKQQTSDMTLIE